MQIRIGHAYMSDFDFKQIEPSEDAPQFKLEVQSLFSSDTKREFITVFKVFVNDPKEYEINATYCTVFTTDDDIDTGFIESHFPSVNTPAIAYPYLRSIISIVSMNFGFTPIVLPTINFTKYNNTHIFLDDKLLKAKDILPPAAPQSTSAKRKSNKKH